MLRRRYHPKKEIAGKAKRRKKKNETVWHSTGSERGFHCSAENGFLRYNIKADLPIALPFPSEQCVCFTGHRILTHNEENFIRNILPHVIADYIQSGKNVFISGGALGFDTIAAQSVLQLKSFFPETKLVMAIPCPDQSARWNLHDQECYQDILHSADQVVLISDSYFPGCMQKRNRFLVEHSNICLCYLTHCRGGTWNTVSYAYDLHRIIRNISQEG